MNEMEAHREWQRDYFSWNPIGEVPKAAVLKIRDLGVNWHSAHWNYCIIEMWLDGQTEIEKHIQEYQDFIRGLHRTTKINVVSPKEG